MNCPKPKYKIGDVVLFKYKNKEEDIAQAKIIFGSYDKHEGWTYYYDLGNIVDFSEDWIVEKLN